eukprot:1161161-Pelagomonas_calceolata.AAC.3
MQETAMFTLEYDPSWLLYAEEIGSTLASDFIVTADTEQLVRMCACVRVCMCLHFAPVAEACTGHHVLDLVTLMAGGDGQLTCAGFQAACPTGTAPAEAAQEGCAAQAASQAGADCEGGAVAYAGKQCGYRSIAHTPEYAFCSGYDAHFSWVSKSSKACDSEQVSSSFPRSPSPKNCSLVTACKQLRAQDVDNLGL